MVTVYSTNSTQIYCHSHSKNSQKQYNNSPILWFNCMIHGAMTVLGTCLCIRGLQHISATEATMILCLEGSMPNKINSWLIIMKFMCSPLTSFLLMGLELTIELPRANMWWLTGFWKNTRALCKELVTRNINRW